MIQVEITKKFKHVYEDDANYMVTNWDKVDVMDYSGSKEYYTPLNYDVAKFYEITVEEHNRLIEEQKKPID